MTRRRALNRSLARTRARYIPFIMDVDCVDFGGIVGHQMGSLSAYYKNRTTRTVNGCEARAIPMQRN